MGKNMSAAVCMGGRDERDFLLGVLTACKLINADHVYSFSDAQLLCSHLVEKGSLDVLFVCLDCDSDINDILSVIPGIVNRYPRMQLVFCIKDASTAVSLREVDVPYSVLLSPVSPRRIDEVVKQASANLDAWTRRPVVFMSNGVLTRINPNEIACIESDLRRVIFHMIDGQTYETYASLRDVMDVLPDNFIQVHKRFIVNLDEVFQLNKDGVVMRGGSTYAVSQARRKLVKEAFLRCFNTRSLV